MKLKSIILGIAFLFPAMNLVAQNDNSIWIELSHDQYEQVAHHFNSAYYDQKRASDWAKFGRYEKANAEIMKKVKAVFMGNSITDGWASMHPDFFKDNGYIGRGISGQTSSEMLVRFRADVINLHPKVVLILAGTNDIARNNGVITLEHVMENIQSMCELAKANKIVPILCSVTPSRGYGWVAHFDPHDSIVELNKMIKAYADKNGYTYLDYFSALVGEDGGMAPGLSNDDCHPTSEGYDIMEPMAKKAIRKYVK